MANNQPTAKAEALKETTSKALARMATEVVSIANGKTWTVTGRTFIGRDGITYSAGMSAPKSNVNVFGWKLASDLFTVADAKALVASKPAHANALFDAMSASKSLVTYLNHETRHAVFVALAKDTSADVAALIASARPSKPDTKRDDVDPFDALGAL